MADFQGKVVIITGSSDGIGKATALSIAKRGGCIVLHGRDEAKLAAVSEECKATGSMQDVIIVGDIGDEDVQKRLIDETVAKYGRIDALVNNAGMGSPSGVAETSVGDLRRLLEVHTVAPFNLCKMAIPHLIKSKGAIVNVSSICGIASSNTVTAYSIAKGAMDAMTRAVACDVTQHDVRVNSVNPGVVRTQIGRGIEEIFESHWCDPSKNPSRRVGQPEEVAELITFLCSDKCSWVTGESIKIDGGLLSSTYCCKTKYFDA